ncbi:hypothetical protein PanWU01x14_331880 [Parasponia andersonii]|uniref:F-box associated beta-propeller type 3 domain-containing protein n=1 Tax=Parasponia andersonii TaxID=3476 RepID=A0A2P5AHF7_PARAD|nr:hypothetical protein PanWU01x14_331880 [Parasponia andersonii]
MYFAEDLVVEIMFVAASGVSPGIQVRQQDLITSYPIPREKDMRYLTTYHSNGIICLVRESKDIMLWNPALMEAKFLPKPGLEYTWGTIGMGFGHDSIANDYKFVSIASHCRYRDYYVSLLILDGAARGLVSYNLRIRKRRNMNFAIKGPCSIVTGYLACSYVKSSVSVIGRGEGRPRKLKLVQVKCIHLGANMIIGNTRGLSTKGYWCWST